MAAARTSKRSTKLSVAARAAAAKAAAVRAASHAKSPPLEHEPAAADEFARDCEAVDDAPDSMAVADANGEATGAPAGTRRESDAADAPGASVGAADCGATVQDNGPQTATDGSPGATATQMSLQSSSPGGDSRKRASPDAVAEKRTKVARIDNDSVARDCDADELSRTGLPSPVDMSDDTTATDVHDYGSGGRSGSPTNGPLDGHDSSAGLACNVGSPAAAITDDVPVSPKSICSSDSSAPSLASSDTSAGSLPASRESSFPIRDHANDAVVDVIQRQFDLEILLKHRELRCIEDEIAKVHIMMVQLRRCAGEFSNGAESDVLAKHYAQYLLPDRRYSESAAPDGQYAAGTHSATNSGVYGRSRSTPNGSGRMMTRGGNNHHTGVAAAPAAPAGPQLCIYRRHDGILVKLICPDCSRTSFGSAQGFINHCRISHSREFASHDNAAQACGIELEEQDEIGLKAQRARDMERQRQQQLQEQQAAAQAAAAAEATKGQEAASLPAVATETVGSAGTADASATQSQTPNSHNTSVQPNTQSNTQSQTNADGKRDYGTKSYPWSYENGSPFAKPAQTTESQADQVPRVGADLDPTKKLASKDSENVPAFPGQLPRNLPGQGVRAGPVPLTRHLSDLLKHNNINVDLADMVEKSVHRDPKGHLFPGEEEVTDDEEERQKQDAAALRSKMKKAGAGGHRGRLMGSGIRVLANYR
ncbi:uncharacterized protein V1510DRAFT_417402 [Dipodascopsis tothii]|uniref:uncharacterized protein n=1 Tax=Dipodascopsis tothii TaxID=44089 RepID=UPI0034CE22B7